MSGVRRYIRNLVRRRTTPVTDQEAADARAAVLLGAGGSEQGAPGEEFVASLHARLRKKLEPRDQGRRRFVQVTSVAAASAAVGVAVDRLVVEAVALPDTAPSVIMPEAGEWQAVVAGRDLPEGGVHQFDLGTLTGFVERVGGQVRGVSGVCTHLGCKLSLDRTARELDCPCHHTAFAVDGRVLRHQLPIQLRPLPTLLVRESGGHVEVFVPTVAT